MTTHNVSNSTEWNALSITDGDTINITTNITFTSQPSRKTIGISTILEGNNNTITLIHTTKYGFLDMRGGTVQNLTIDGNNGNVAERESLFAYNSTNQWGDFINCRAQNANLGQYAGGICGYYFGHYTDTNISHLTGCSSNCRTGNFGGGLLGQYCRNIEVLQCYFNGEIGGYRSGGIVGDGFGTSETNSIKECWVSCDINYSLCAGIVAGTGSGATIVIEKCFFIGAISSSSSGICCILHNTGSLTINDCYSVGSIASECSGIVGNTSSGATTMSTTLNRCYSIGPVSSGGGGLVKGRSGSATVYINDCVCPSPITIRDTLTSVSNTSTDLNDINGSIKSGWSSSTWAAGPTYPLLRTFIDNWTGYTDYNIAPTSLGSSTTTLYRIVSNIDGLFAGHMRGNRYRITRKNPPLFVGSDATAVLNHMNTKYPQYTWAAEEFSFTVNEDPPSLPSIESSDPAFNCIRSRTINTIKYYRKSDDTLSNNQDDGEIIQLTRSQIRTERNNGWEIIMLSRV